MGKCVYKQLTRAHTSKRLSKHSVLHSEKVINEYGHLAMNLFSTIFKAFKDGTTQIGEPQPRVSDITLLGNTLQDAHLHLTKTKHSHAALMAQQQLGRNKVIAIDAQIHAKKEQVRNMYSSSAISQNDEATALNIAGEIVHLEEALATEDSLATKLLTHIDTLSSQINDFAKHVAEIEDQLRQVKATNSIQESQVLMNKINAPNNTHIMSIDERLAQIKNEQEATQAHIEVAHEVAIAISSTPLHDRLDKNLAENTKNTQAQDMLNHLKIEK